MGFLAGSVTIPGAVACAGELTAQQLQTIAIPKRLDSVALAPTLGTLKTGNGLQPAKPAITSPLVGLSLSNLSLSAPATPADSSPSSVSQQNGNIRYSVAPDSSFTPFVGIGTGRATGLLNAGLSHPAPYDTSDALHSYEGLAGFDYKVDKDTHLDFDYRMSNTQRPNVPMLDNANIADQGRDRAAILSLHYSLDPVLRVPHD